MKIIVIGCGRLGAELAYRLFQRSNEVSVVDIKPSAFNNLPSDFNGRLNEGDAMNQDVLHRAGIETADALAAVTSSDATNMVIAHVANQNYHVARVVARNFNPSCCSIFDTFGIQMVSPSSWGAQRLEEMLSYEGIRTLFSLGNGEVEVYELAIPTSWTGRSIQDLSDAEDCIITSMTRAGRSQLPEPTLVFQNGDLLQVSASVEGILMLQQKLGLHKENK